MKKRGIFRIAIILIAASALCGWTAFISAGRAQAAAAASPWGELLKEKCDVQIQFMDAQTVTTSTWYSGTVVGYDGNFITFINAGMSERIYIPLTAIRQLEVMPPGSAAAAAPKAN